MWYRNEKIEFTLVFFVDVAYFVLSISFQYGVFYLLNMIFIYP